MGNQSLALYFGELIAHITPVLVIGSISAMVSKNGLKNGIVNHSLITSFIIGIIALLGNIYISNQNSGDLSLKTPIYFLIVIPVIIFSVSFILENSSWNEKSEIKIKENKVFQDFKNLFSGRMGRLDFFKYQLAGGIAWLGGLFLIGFQQNINSNLLSLLLYIFAILLIFLGFFYIWQGYIKRLHDLNHSGWWSLVALTGYFGIDLVDLVIYGLSIFLLFCPGNKKSNKYSEIPNLK